MGIIIWAVVFIWNWGPPNSAAPEGFSSCFDFYFFIFHFFFFFSLSFFPFLFPSYFFILITPFTQIITLVIAIDAHWPGSVNETADNAKSISYSHLFQVVPHSVWTQRLSSKNCKQLTSSFPRSSRLSAQSLFRFQAFEPTTLYLFACL